MHWKAPVVAALLVVSMVGATAAVSAESTGTQQGEAYTGTHVSFETTGNTVSNYSVGGRTLVGSLGVQSASEAESSGVVGAGAELSSVTKLSAAGLSLSATTETHATVESQSGATLTTHDNERGIVVVQSGGESQYVRANVSSNGEAESESEKRVVVTGEDGTTGTFLVVGDGEVTVNERGNVTARLGEDGRLVYRQYRDERSDSEKEQEDLIASGKAAAEVYVQSAGESGEQGEQRAVDVVNYSEDTTVEVGETAQNRVNMTVERSASEGRVIITSVSEEVVGSAEDVEVTVDGEAAVRASSYSEVESATNDGDTSKFLVESSSSAEASSDVVVGINHFSTRSVTIQDASGDDGDTEASGEDGSDGETTPEGSSGSGPGFGVAVSVLALLGAALLARFRA